jgi:uncharacterized membrane protein
MSNPYAPGVMGEAAGAMVPPELATKAGNIQLMGILSIVFAFCCGCVGIVLSIIVLVQAGGVTAALQQYGNPPDLVSKVSTGKLCAIIGLVLTVVVMIIGVAVNLLQLSMAVQQAG